MSRRILLIDDGDLLREAIGELLESNGYVVVSAGAGDAGLAMFRAAAPDLVITDLTMPEPNGLDIVRILSKEVPRPRVMVISGGAERLDSLSSLRRAQAIGADKILEKPFRAKRLLEMVNAILEEGEIETGEAGAG